MGNEEEVGSIKVMIVDDEEQFRYILKKALERRGGYEVVEAGSGQECLEKLETESPDLILMDIMMPGMDGWEVCKRIKESDSIGSTKVVMFSVKNNKQDRLKSITYSRADMHIEKSPDFNGLVKTINELVGSVPN